MHKGIGAGPSVWFGDTAEIPLLGLSTGKRFDYRLAWLAQDNDIVVIGGQNCTAFEAYQRNYLHAPGIRYLNVDPDAVLPRRATPRICLRDPAAFSDLCDALAGEGSVTLHAHITTGTIWALAARLTRTIKADVFVAGPPPLLSRRANDKLWFGHMARRLLGAGAIPEKRTAYSKSALTRHVAELAREWDRLVVKVPDSAGSAGNFPVRSQDVRGLQPAALYRHLVHVLSDNGRTPVFPMLVEVWDANVLTSPSVQMWIPDPDDGPPLVEEIFEQLLHGEEATFSGALPADLPPAVESTLTSGALQLATLFQRLGYYGRCSFDAIVTGPDIEAGTVHWIECNARWGGASIPMSLVHRLAKQGDRPHYAIVQSDKDTFRALDFADAEREFADVALLPDLCSGILFLSPNMMELGKGCHFLSLGADVHAAKELARATVDRLRGS
ncbi:hypothetical protein [uncultured Hoeflea sp.]|uniref:preATP grasp domain-containing protein n=1 Tax=uncultured Hoeflea sp. TaxID=538666 RepID=UPI0030DC15C8